MAAGANHLPDHRNSWLLSGQRLPFAPIRRQHPLRHKAKRRRPLFLFLRLRLVLEFPSYSSPSSSSSSASSSPCLCRFPCFQAPARPTILLNLWLPSIFVRP